MKDLFGRFNLTALLAIPVAGVLTLTGCGGSVDNTADKPDQPVKSVSDDTWTVESGKTGASD